VKLKRIVIASEANSLSFPPSFGDEDSHAHSAIGAVSFPHGLGGNLKAGSSTKDFGDDTARQIASSVSPPRHDKKIPIGRLILLAGLFLLSAARADAAQSAREIDAYRSLPDHKSLKTAPQFVLVDDFSSGKLKNARGEPWQVKAPPGGGLDMEVVKEDARNPQRGHSLKTSFNILPKETVQFKSLLHRLDISQAQYLVFKCRLVPSQGLKFTGRVRVSLSDWRHNSAERDIADACSDGDGQWHDAVLPLSTFRDLDLDQVFSIEFAIKARAAKESGELFVDEIAFFGFNDVAFESHRDNLTGFPKTVVAKQAAQVILSLRNRAFLKAIARDTWKYFVNAREKNSHLVVDHIRLGAAPLAADYTSPTNIAMDVLATISAQELGLITRSEALKQVTEVMATLKQLRRYKGFFYNFYDARKLQVSRPYISTVDSGWLAIALVIVRQAYAQELGEDATALLNGFTFAELLDPENNQLVVGMDVPERNFGLYHYGMLVSEARATSFYAIGKGDLPKDHWWFLYRTLPDSWKWQTQPPQGTQKERDGTTYLQGHYSRAGQKFVPSWGGSLFEVLMPTLVINEKKLAPKGLGLNNKIFTELQRDYALKEKKYPVWGLSPASTTSGRGWNYQEFGAKPLGAKGYPDLGVVTPHVSFLALEVLPKDAIKNLRTFLKHYPIYGEYGFYDSVNVKNGRVNTQYLALDQGMSLAAICNYLRKGILQDYFQRDPVFKAAASVLDEDFFN